MCKRNTNNEKQGVNMLHTYIHTEKITMSEGNGGRKKEANM
jgi:hypothetical protein